MLYYIKPLSRTRQVMLRLIVKTCPFDSKSICAIVFVGDGVGVVERWQESYWVGIDGVSIG